MAKADVLQLVQDLSAGMADATAASNYYTDIVDEMGLGPNESLVGASFIPVLRAAGNITQPPSALRPLLLCYDDTALEVTDILEAQVYDKQWRTTLGEPRAWLVEQESQRQIVLVPVPQRSGSTITTTPFNDGFPESNILMFYTESRPDVHPYEELLVALQILAREFERESDHTDHVASQYCVALASLFQAMLASKV